MIAAGPARVLEIKHCGEMPDWLGAGARGPGTGADSFSKFRMGMIALGHAGDGAPEAEGRHRSRAASPPLFAARVRPMLREAGRMFIVFEGIDGSGKTTISNRVAKALRERGLTVEHLREEGAFASSVTQGIRDFCRDARNLALVPAGRAAALRGPRGPAGRRGAAPGARARRRRHRRSLSLHGRGAGAGGPRSSRAT